MAMDVVKSSNIKYLPQVAHLRAVAALLIVFYHGEQHLGAKLGTGKGFSNDKWHFTDNPLLAMVLEGHTAVGLFMTLSGFIFTWGAWQRTVEWRPFMLNRLLRIYPLYIVTILLALALNPKAFALDGLVAMLLPLATVKKLEAGPLVGMSWAVAVEFQFYLLFPLLLARLNRAPLRSLVGVLLLTLALRTLGVGLGGRARDLGYWQIFGRMDEFVLGMAAAAVLRTLQDASPKRVRSLCRPAFGVALLVAFGVIFVFHKAGGYPSTSSWKLLWPPLEGLTWAFFIASYVGADLPLPSLLSRLVAQVGELSFSIYLPHVPVITVLKNHIGWIPRWTGHASNDALLATITIVLPFVLLLSLITYETIEKPFLQMRVRYLRDSSPTT